MSCACSTLFFHCDPRELIAQYEAICEPANGYLTCLNDEVVLVDALATEQADWGRQTSLAAALTGEDGVALSIFIVGAHWALALAVDGKEGPVAAYVPDDPDALDDLPRELMIIETGLARLFPGLVNAQELDLLFGAMLEGAVPVEEAINSLLAMLGVAPDWLRWSWYETIPEQLFIDPDLADRVTPLGEARLLWEE